MWTSAYSKTAIKTLRRMPKNVAVQIRSRVERVAADPYAPNNNVTKLKGSDYYRLRVGDWRAVYELVDDELVVEVITIGVRVGVYE